MGPWSTIAVTAAASQVFSSGVRQLNAVAETFQDVFAATPEAGEHVDSDAEASSSLVDSIAERVAQLFQAAGLEFNTPIELELSPLGNVYVSGQSLETAEIERILDQDQGLRGLLSDWYSTSGGSSVHIAPAKGS